MSRDHLIRAGLMKFFIVEPIFDIARYDLVCFHIDPCAQVSDLQIDPLGSGIVRIILLELLNIPRIIKMLMKLLSGHNLLAFFF